ncbi:D-lactaldehyde dehydrogenase [Thelephora terrestris]|uniref:D-lactaldehyde dehydrogenase n=1 Tax=Thelephora terrestris TaxID=56493 RepID=A0A9P6HPU2_9AGAM|nr:D-lactaldehyde dehydrogenase [Thelephora terrestris]
MPIITPGRKVLVTGANGFVAIHIVDNLLKNGYFVRATIRSESKEAHLKKLFSKYGDKLEFVVVPDITRDGAFDHVVDGLDAILHTASPFQYDVKDPEELIRPAVDGTLSVLKSAIKAPGNIKRVIILSSSVSVGLLRFNHEYTEEEWNDSAIDDVKAKGKESNGLVKYMASKTLAERAAWELYRKHKASLPWDMVAINPPYIFGPNLHEVDKPENLNTSSKRWFDLFFNPIFSDQELYFAGNWVDVRDVAAAHVAALEKEEAADERIVIAAGPVPEQEFIEAAKRAAASLGIKGVQTGIKKYDPANVKNSVIYSSKKRERILGIKITSVDESVRDTIADFKERGWIPA